MTQITTRLQQAEEVIEQGLVAYREAGKALMDIRDEGLYRANFDTFEEYCQERWNLSRPRVYQLIDASKLAINLSTIVDIPNEGQARELKKLDSPDLQRAAYGVAETIAEQNKAGKVTAKDVKKAVELVHQVIEQNPTIPPEDISAKAVELGATHDIEPEYTEIDALRDQVTELQDLLAANGLNQADAKEYVEGLRKEIKTLKAMVDALTISRDTYQNENAQLKKQIKMMQKNVK